MNPLKLLEKDFQRRGLTASYLKAVTRVAGRFLRFASPAPRRIKRRDVEAYLADRTRFRSAKHQHRALRELQSFFAVLVRGGVIEASPAEGVEVKKPARDPQRLLTEAQVERLLRAASGQENAVKALRDRACLELLYGLGIRAQELREARVTDLSLACGTLHVRRAKGGKPDLAPLPKASLPHLERYLKESRPHLLVRDGRDQGRLLLSDDGRPLLDTRVNNLVARISRLAEVRANPHCFRRSLATHLLRSGVNVEVVRQLLGHSTLVTTAIYLVVDRDELRRTVAILEHG